MLARGLRNAAAQGGFLLAPLLERVILVGVLVRSWGIERFADWAGMFAAAALVAIFEMSAGIYFGNRMREAHVNGNEAAFQRVLGVGLTVLGTLALTLAAVCAGVLVLVDLPRILNVHATTAGDVRLTLAFLCGTQVLQIASSSISQVFRGRGEYAVGQSAEVVLSLAIVGIVTVSALGGIRPVQLAAIYAGLQAVLRWPALILLIRARYPTLRLHPAAPTGAEVRDFIRRLGWLAIIQASMVVLVHGCLLTPKLFGVSAAAFTAFLAARTLVNLLRQLCQFIANGFGVEIAGDVLAGRASDEAIAATSRLLTLSAGVGAGGLVCFGPHILDVWLAGQAKASMVAIAWLVVPAIVCARGQVVTAALVYTNLVRAPALAAASQAVMSLALVVVLGANFGVTGLAAGLALGEIFGLGVVLPAVAGEFARSAAAWRRDIPAAAGLTALSAAGALAILVVVPIGVGGLSIGAGSWAIGVACPLLVLGLPGDLRRSGVRWLMNVLGKGERWRMLARLRRFAAQVRRQA
jgi:O-antigen/teichoic acid export membrane protein